jgi:hypothetical protein
MEQAICEYRFGMTRSVFWMASSSVVLSPSDYSSLTRLEICIKKSYTDSPDLNAIASNSLRSFWQRASHTGCH